MEANGVYACAMTWVAALPPPFRLCRVSAGRSYAGRVLSCFVNRHAPAIHRKSLEHSSGHGMTMNPSIDLRGLSSGGFFPACTWIGILVSSAVSFHG
jgi:hypothetical protein